MHGDEKIANRPIYKCIYDRLVEDIAAGAYPVGSNLPPEHLLCKRFGASRNTVRCALQELQLAGLIRRRQGSGSRVVSQHPPERFISSVQSIDELMQYVAETRLEILTLERVLADGAVQAKIGGAPDDVWLRISALRRSQGASRPIAYTEIFIADRFAEVADLIGKNALPVYRILEEQCGVHISQVRQSIQAETADRNLSSRLLIEPESPVLRISREYLTDADGVVEIAVNYHPAERFRYDIVLKRGEPEPE